LRAKFFFLFWAFVSRFIPSFLPSIASRFKLCQVSCFSISRNKSAGSYDRCSPGSLLGFLSLSSCRSQTNRQTDR
jgi:hypothetical protein